MNRILTVIQQPRYASRNSTKSGACPTIPESFGSRIGRKVFIRLRTEFSLPHCLPIPVGRSGKDSLSCCRMFQNDACRSIDRSERNNPRRKRRQPAYSTWPFLSVTVTEEPGAATCKIAIRPSSLTRVSSAPSSAADSILPSPNMFTVGPPATFTRILE